MGSSFRALNPIFPVSLLRAPWRAPPNTEHELCAGSCVGLGGAERNQSLALGDLMVQSGRQTHRHPGRGFQWCSQHCLPSNLSPTCQFLCKRWSVVSVPCIWSGLTYLLSGPSQKNCSHPCSGSQLALGATLRLLDVILCVMVSTGEKHGPISELQPPLSNAAPHSTRSQ